jgi:tetratricopeptide (TPR) repeat protein
MMDDDLTCRLIFFKGMIMDNIAGSYSFLGRHREALVLYQKVLEFRRRVLPESHSDIGASYIKVSLSQRKAGDFHRALENAREGLRIFQATLPPSNPGIEQARVLVGALMGNIASTYHELGRFQEAVALQEKSLEEIRRCFPENHPQYAETGNTSLNYLS